MGGERGLGGTLFWGVDTSVWGRENSVEREDGVLVPPPPSPPPAQYQTLHFVLISLCAFCVYSSLSISDGSYLSVFS